MSPADERTHASRRRQRRSRLWFTVHSWVGVKLYLVLAIILVSGTLAVFAREIDWLLLPEMRVAPLAERAPLGEVVAALRRAHPEVGILEGFVETNVEHPRTAARAIGVTLEHGARAYWIDPYRARVTGDTSLLSPGFVLAQLHASLFVPVVGNLLVSLFALFVVTSTVTGMLVYKRWWRGFARRPRRRSARLLAGDLHRLLGVWSLAFLLVIGATSLFFLWDYLFVQMLALPERPHAAEPAELSADRMASLDEPRRLPLDTLLGAVAHAHPSFAVTGVALPQHAAAPLSVFGTGGEVLAGAFASRVDVDPFDGRIVASELIADAGAWRRVNEAVDPLHFGHFAGLAGRIAWFLFGAACSALALTGVFVHVRRLAGRAPRTRRSWRPWGGPMGVFRPLAFGIVALAVYGVSVFAAQLGAIGSRAHQILPEQTAGPWRASIVVLAEPGLLPQHAALEAGAPSLLLLRPCTGCAETIKAARVGIAGPDGTCAAHERVEGERDYLHARLRVPPEGATSVCLTLEGWDGERGETSWPIATAAPAG